tara:strand:+ start:423 stop:950 length:528 start_codon:yes stop_codon:yes gene_type:complete
MDDQLAAFAHKFHGAVLKGLAHPDGAFCLLHHLLERGGKDFTMRLFGQVHVRRLGRSKNPDDPENEDSQSDVAECGLGGCPWLLPHRAVSLAAFYNASKGLRAAYVIALDFSTPHGLPALQSRHGVVALAAKALHSMSRLHSLNQTIDDDGFFVRCSSAIHALLPHLAHSNLIVG